MLILFLFYCAIGQQITLNVDTTDGPIQGAQLAPNVLSFLGIPYAAPPTGANRWKPTQPPTPWVTTRSAAFWGAQCINSTNTTQAGTEFPSGVEWSEDCLFLDVYVPNTATVNKSVLVWFHGGAFNYGGGAAAKYHGFVLAAKEDVIVVNVNYRLGLFGFFSLPQLLTEDPTFPSTGNYGFMDQIQALKWVQNNIAAFGGNPEAVTIGGESVGASSVSYHMTSSRSQTGFSKAVMLSDTAFFQQITLATAFSNANQSLRAIEALVFPDAFGPSWVDICSDGSDSVKYLTCLRAVPADVLWQFSPPFSFVTMDGYFFNETAFMSFNAGRYTKVPVVALNDRDEGTPFLYTDATPMNESSYSDFLSGQLKFPPVLLPVVLDFYGPCDGDCRKPASAVFGDVGVICPTQIISQMVSAQSGNVFYFVWARLLSYAPPFLGAYHTSDTPYWFGTIPYSNPFANAIEQQLAVTMSGYLGAFVKGDSFNATENPNIPYDWPEYSFPSRTALLVQPDGNFSTVDHFGDEHCYLWKVVFPNLYTPDGGSFSYVFPETFTFGPSSSAATFLPTLLSLCVLISLVM